jgi:hypothetical protein
MKKVFLFSLCSSLILSCKNMPDFMCSPMDPQGPTSYICEDHKPKSQKPQAGDVQSVPSNVPFVIKTQLPSPEPSPSQLIDNSGSVIYFPTPEPSWTTIYVPPNPPLETPQPTPNPTPTPQPSIYSDNNNGHGNDSDKHDESNPGKKKDK